MQNGNFLTFDERMNLLTARGLTIENKVEAAKFLENVDYYRFIRYVNVFQEKEDRFYKGITFSDIQNVYVFDKHLRKILFDVVDTIEISVRAQTIKYVGQKIGAFGYLDKNNFQDTRGHQRFTFYLSEKLEQRIAEEVIDDRRRHNLQEIPIWQALELCTFNMLMNFYELLPSEIQDQIASAYRCTKEEFASWINAFVVLRNITAHHGRLFDRHFENKVIWKSEDYSLFKNADATSFSAVLYAVKQILCILDSGMYHEIITQMEALFNAYPGVKKEWLGSASQEVWSNLYTI